MFFFSRFFDRKIQSGNDGKYEKFQELERSRSAKPWKPSDEDGLFLFFSFFKKQKNIDIIIVVVVSLTARRAGNWRTQRAGRAATLKIKKEKPTQTHTHTHTHTHARNKKKAKKKLERKKNGETKRDNKTPRMTSRLILSAYFTRKKTRERERERDKLPFSASRLSRRRPVQGVSLFLAGHVLFYFFLGNRFHFFFVCVAPSDFVRRWIEPGFIYGTDEFNREGSSFIIIIIITIIIVFHSIVDEADGLQVLIDTEPKQRTTMRSIQFRGFTGF